MMRWIVEGSLRIRFFLVFAAAAMVFFGFGQLREMRTDVFPEFAPPLAWVDRASDAFPALTFRLDYAALDGSSAGVKEVRAGEVVREAQEAEA